MTRSVVTTILLGLLVGPMPSRAQITQEGVAASGVRALQQGRTQEALVLLDRAVKERPQDLRLRMLLGQANLAAGLWVPAKQQFETILEMQPGHPLAAFLRGFALYQASRYHEAAEALASAARLAPGNPNPKSYRGRALIQLGRPEEARRQLNAALSLAAGDPVARIGLAELELADGRAEEAEAMLRDILAEDPGGPVAVEARVLLSRALIDAGRAREAVADLRVMVEQIPHRSDLLYLLAQSLLRSGESEEGGEVLARFRHQKALEERIRLLDATVGTESRGRDERIELVKLLLENGQPGTAALRLAPLLRQWPDDREVQALAREIERAGQ